jgi:hypothetical protein
VERLVGGYFILDVWRGWVLIMDDIFDWWWSNFFMFNKNNNKNVLNIICYYIVLILFSDTVLNLINRNMYNNKIYLLIRVWNKKLINLTIYW